VGARQSSKWGEIEIANFQFNRYGEFLDDENDKKNNNDGLGDFRSRGNRSPVLSADENDFSESCGARNLEARESLCTSMFQVNSPGRAKLARGTWNLRQEVVF